MLKHLFMNLLNIFFINEISSISIANENSNIFFKAIEIIITQFHITGVSLCLFGFCIVSITSRESSRISRYKNFIKYEQAFQAQGRTLADFDPRLGRQLDQYRLTLLSQIKWSNKYKYISLMSDFVEDQILVEQYIKGFDKLEKECQTILISFEQDSDKIEKLSNVSREFSQLLQQAYIDCQNFESNINSKNSTTLLKKKAHYILLKLQKLN